MSPAVSIIIPNYNHASYLVDRIESVLQQTFQDFEILFLDDASTDNSRDVFEKYSTHPKIKTVWNSQNSGSTFRQWNRGASLARGEFLWFAESDDYAEPTLLERLMESLEQNPQCGLAYCQSWEVDTEKNRHRTFQWFTDEIDPEKWKNDFVCSGSDALNHLLVKNIIPNASAAVLRKSTFVNAAGADETMKLCGDWMLWSKILSTSSLSFVAEPLNYFRHHESSVRTQKMRSLDYVAERYRIVEFIRKHATVSAEFLEDQLNLMADLWEAYAREASCNFGLHWNIFKAARRADPGILGRLFNKTLRPGAGEFKNRLLRKPKNPTA